jgi:hypothetical protein
MCMIKETRRIKPENLIYVNIKLTVERKENRYEGIKPFIYLFYYV